MLQGIQRRARREHPPGERQHRLFTRALLGDLQKRSAFRGFFRRALITVINADQQRAETDRGTNTYIDGVDPCRDLVEGLQDGNGMWIGVGNGRQKQRRYDTGKPDRSQAITDESENQPPPPVARKIISPTWSSRDLKSLVRLILPLAGK